MNYLHYVVAAYAVFAIVLAWDYITPRMQLRQQLRAARMRAARGDAARTSTSIGVGDNDLEKQL